MDLEARVAACELETKELRGTVRSQRIVWSIALVIACIGSVIATLRLASFDTIRAKEIVVTDANGVVRARMAGDLPDGTSHGGRVMPRGTTAAGFIIYDVDGYERGGYATLGNDNAMISLDSKYAMVANLIAGPDEGGTGVLNLISQTNQMELRADDDGARLSMARDNEVHTQTPEIPINAEVCAEYRKVEPKWCRTRFSANACNLCLKDA